MISKKIRGCEEKKNFIGKSLKIIFLAVFILLIFPDLTKAFCGPACVHSDGTYDMLSECNDGVTSCAGSCGWAYNVWYSDVGYLCKNDPCFVISGTSWVKDAKFPDTTGYNGRPCAVYSSGFLTCNKNGEGVWNASQKKCIQCNGKVESKSCGNTSSLSLGCAAAGDGEFETACNAGVDPKCDDKYEDYVCGTGGLCDANGQCVGEPAVCTPTTPLCNGVCPAGCTVAQDPDCGCLSGNSCCGLGCNNASDSDCPAAGNCELDCSCSCPLGIPCPGGRCDGGLVPCGRTCDDKCTKNCECAPCTLCHLFVLFKRIVDFLTINIIFPLAILMIVIGGVMFLTAGGDPGRIGGAKKILTATIIGLVIILTAWLLVDTVIMFLVPASSPFQNWETIDCPVCGDGNCDSGETTTNCPADCGAPPPPPPPPGCAPGTCDTANRIYCDAGVWTPQDDPLYCSNCDNCVDGVKNCGETGIDCGGGGCLACAAGACPSCIICP
jgi:hypothetical protein